MADSDFLNTSDLAGFTQNVQQSNPWGMAAQGIGAWRPDMSTWSGTESGIASFAKSFLSGLLGNYARQQTADQLSKVVEIMPQLRKDPMSVVAPEGVASGAFSLLRGSAVMKNAAPDAGGEQPVDLRKRLVGVFGDEAKAQAKGNIQGQIEGSSAPGANLVPGTPGYKMNQDRIQQIDKIRSDFNALPEVKTFSIAQKAAQSMAGALKDKGGTSDLELVRYAIQMIEPGMAVREGEQQAVLNSSSIPEAWKGMLDKSLKGESQLNDNVREGLKRLASRAYESQKGAYDKAQTYYQGLAEGRGLPKDSQISYLGTAPESSAIFGATSKPKLKASELRARGYTPGPNGWVPPAQ